MTIPEPPNTTGPVTTPRDPVLVLVTNLLVFGCLGYFLLGQKKKGIAAVVLVVLSAIPTWCLGPAILCVVAAIDGFMQAQLAQRGARIGDWTFFGQSG